jgi:hypothetical protein
MRARSLKPGFFKNELLGSADPLIAILFEGLWCCADREGRLEDRPLRLCAEVFPYRRTVTEKKVDNWLDWLHEHGFVIRYEVSGKRFIQIVEFLTHQNPHKKERPSQIQAPTGFKHSASTGLDTNQAPGEDGPKPERAGLTPDSGLLTPLSESKNPQPPKGGELAHTRSEREIRKIGLDAWDRACRVIDAIRKQPNGLTWADGDKALNDPLAAQAIKAAGGHKAIADRTQFTVKDFKRRFREHYEAALANGREMESPNGHDSTKQPQQASVSGLMSEAAKGMQ